MKLELLKILATGQIASIIKDMCSQNIKCLF